MKSITALCSLLFSPFLFAAELVVSDAYVQANVPGSDNTIAYMTLQNPADSDIKIVAAATDVAASAELHSHVIKNDRMQMRQVDSISVDARGKVSLNPNGYHLMLIGLHKRIKPQEEVAVQLIFADKTTQTIKLIAVDTRKHHSDRHKHHHNH